MSWDVPDRSWRFGMGGEPPGDLPDAWAAAALAVSRDLTCQRYGGTSSVVGMAWSFQASDGAIAVGFDGLTGIYHRCMGYLLDTSAPQATVWLAGDVQYELAGFEWMQWPIAGQNMLDARIVDDHAVWVQPGTNAVAAPIGELCTAAEEPTSTGRQPF
jgi:hypothetical protein